jgi:glycosyltransferase involved in cell wall biosynthesis
VRVVLDLRWAQPGSWGIGTYAVNLCLSLETISKGFEVEALTTAAGADYLRPLVRSPLHVVPSHWRWDELHLPALLRKMGGVIYHTPLFVLPSTRSCTYVCTIHDAIPRSRPDLTSMAFRQFFEQHVPHALRVATHVVTVSHHSRRDLLRHFAFDQDRITTIHEAVSPQLRRHSLPEVETTMREFRLNRGFVLHVGAIERRKNIDRLLDAYGLLRKTGNFERALVIVGAPRGEGYDLAAEVDRRGLGSHVRILGRVSDRALRHLYSAAGVVAFPSLYEGFGLPVVEAMASGTPVVTSRATSLEEIADGAAVLVDAEDAQQLADAILRVSSNPGLQEDLRARGLQRAAMFTVAKQGERIQQLYRRLCESD